MLVRAGNVTKLTKSYCVGLPRSRRETLYLDYSDYHSWNVIWDESFFAAYLRVAGMSISSLLFFTASRYLCLLPDWLATDSVLEKGGDDLWQCGHSYACWYQQMWYFLNITRCVQMVYKWYLASYVEMLCWSNVWLWSHSVWLVITFLFTTVFS